MHRKGHPVQGCIMRTSKRPNGAAALSEIRKYQSHGKVLIPKATFSKVMKTIAKDLGVSCRFSKKATEAVQEAAEAKVVKTLKKANLIAIHAKRVSITKKDMELVKTLEEEE